MSKIEIPCDAYVPNATYYIQVDSWNLARGYFTISVSTEACPAPVNDICGNAINIPVDGVVVEGTNSGATVSANLVVNCGIGDLDTDADVWYKFTTPAASTGLIIETSSIDGAPDNLSDSQIQIFSTCGNVVPALYCDDDNGTGFMSKISVPCGGLAQNTNYYVQVDSWNTARGVFGISVTPVPCTAPANDLCSNAIALTLNEPGGCVGNETAGTTSGATSDGLLNVCESSSIDVFYTFNSGPSYQVVINAEKLDVNTDLLVSVMTGSCAGESIICMESTAVNMVDVTPNTNYVVRLHSNLIFGTPGDFTICIERVAPQIATVNGTITGWNSSCAARNVTVSMKNVLTGTITISTALLSTSGNYSIIAGSVPAGTYHILVKINGALAVLTQNVVLSGGANSFTSARGRLGDINNNNAINFLDVSTFSAAYGKTVGMTGYNILADLNCDGNINLTDISLLSSGFGKVGATLP